jgi:hypothetical protein
MKSQSDLQDRVSHESTILITALGIDLYLGYSSHNALNPIFNGVGDPLTGFW